MIFTEHRFLLFFGAAFALYWSLRGNGARKLLLLVASYAFYSAWDWRFLSLLIASTLCDYVAGLGIARSTERRVQRRWLWCSIVINLGLLATFKYLGFFVDSAVDFLHLLGFEASRPVLAIVLPVGISFYTFQTLSYTFDVYSGKQPATRNLLDFALFVAFFPQLLAGPIVRPREFLPQLATARRWEQVQARAMLWMFLVGFFKKACVSDNIHVLVDAFYAHPADYTAASGVVAGLFFTVQLYCDFSGYSDMAIACAGLLGYALPLNFWFPLLSADYTKLMNRWHMTLSRWVRDYVYLPLVGKSRSPWRQLWCLAVTMFLVGLWHGAGWHFVVWGLGMGLGAAVHRVWQLSPWSKHWRGPLAHFAGMVLTFSWLVLMLVLFRSESLTQAAFVFRSWLGLVEAGSLEFGLGPWLVFAGLALVHYAFLRLGPERRVAALPGPAFAVLMGALVPLCLAFAKADVEPFVYFQF